MKNRILPLLLISFGVCTSSLSAQASATRDTALRQTIIDQDIKIGELKKNVSDLQDSYQKLKGTFDQFQVLNSGVSNYLTIISIVLTILTVALPAINLFTVILPNRKVRSRLRKLEKDFPKKVDENFENYMVSFDRKRFDVAIDDFRTNNNYSGLSSLLLLSSYSLSETQYHKIIEKLNEGIEIPESEAVTILNALINPDSQECDKFFRMILETDSRKYLQHTAEYLARIDIAKNMKYLEKVLAGRADLETLIVKVVNAITKTYLGTIVDKKPEASRTLGQKKIEFILNNEKIVEKFDVSKISSTGYPGGEFLANINMVDFNPFLKETELYKRHYSATARI